MDGWRPLPVSYSSDIRRFLKALLFFNQTKCFVSILQPKWHVDISIWHFCRHTVEIATWEDRYFPPLGSTRAEWAATLHLCCYITSLSERRSIAQVFDARLKRSKSHRNDCVNEAQTDCYYQVICCVCCVKIYQLCSKAHLSLYFIWLFVSS